MSYTKKLFTYLENSSAEVDEKIEILKSRYDNKIDPWGLNLNTLSYLLKTIHPFYKDYFKVKVFGKENIPKDQNFLAVSNHSGQIPIDGMLILTAFIMGLDEPNILRGMAERFLFKLPLLGRLACESGTILGDRKNCRYLLENDESILVFPEGVKGISKPTSKFYQLQHFTNGFYKLALEYDTPVLPITVIGAEEFYPFVYHNKTLAKLLNVPAFPITPLFPFFGLLGAIPKASPVEIHIGKLIYPNKNLSPTSEKKSLELEVNKIKAVIQEKINQLRNQK